MAFTVALSDRARRNLKALRKREQQIVLQAIDEQLVHQPDVPTRNRKRLEENSLAPWELRVGNLRIFYDVDPGSKQVVIMAIGQKTHNILTIGGQEISL